MPGVCSKKSLILSRVSTVRAEVAPGGSFTAIRKYPLSSAGTKLVGKKWNTMPVPAAKTSNVITVKLKRWLKRANTLPYQSLKRSRPRLNLLS